MAEEDDTNWIEILYGPLKDTYLERTKAWYRLLKVVHLALAYLSTGIFVLIILGMLFDGGTDELGGILVGGGIALFVFLFVIRFAAYGLIYILGGNTTLEERYRKLLQIVDHNTFMETAQKSALYSQELKDSNAKLEEFYKKNKRKEDDYYDNEKIKKMSPEEYKEFNALVHQRNQTSYLNFLNTGNANLYEQMNDALLSGTPVDFVKKELERQLSEIFDQFSSGIAKLAYSYAIAEIQEKELENGTYGRDIDSETIKKRAQDIYMGWLGVENTNSKTKSRRRNGHTKKTS